MLIPVFAIHRDSMFYADPEKYVPERFASEESEERPSCTFIDVTKDCSMMAAKVVLALLLMNFQFPLHPSTVTPLRFVNHKNAMEIQDRIFMKVKKI